MMRFIYLVLLALWMGACEDSTEGTKPGNVEPDADTDTDADSDTDSDPTMSLLVLARFDGNDIVGQPYGLFEDDVQVASGTTNEESTVPVTDDGLVWVGDNKSGWTDDEHRVCEINGVQYTHSKVEVNGDEVEVGLNMFADGSWTCELTAAVSGDTYSQTAEVTYKNGNTIQLPGLEALTVTGSTLYASSNGVVQSGSFLNAGHIYVVSTGGMGGDATADCTAN